MASVIPTYLNHAGLLRVPLAAALSEPRAFDADATTEEKEDLAAAMDDEAPADVAAVVDIVDALGCESG